MLKTLKREILCAHFVSMAAKLPIVSTFIRPFAQRFEEGSIVKISRGMAAGMLWKRYHRNLNAYWLGNHELPVQKRVVRELKEGNIFFDVGANAGFFSLIAARCVGSKGRVFSFEPVPMSAEVIRDQFEINGLYQCSCVESAVGSSEGEGEVIIPNTGNMKASLPIARLRKGASEDIGGEAIQTFRVPLITLDSFVDRENVVPDLLKIDVEGAESEVLAGGASLLSSNFAPRLVIEIHGDVVAGTVDKKLREAGYRYYTMQGKPLPNINGKCHLLAYPPHILEKPILT